jgi:phenylalanyl-tRNA synthetase alpha chain
MIEKIKSIQAELAKERPTTKEELERFRLEFLGKKGKITLLFDLIKQIPPAEKRSVGALLNDLKQQAQIEYEQWIADIHHPPLLRKQATEDYTLPPAEHELGTLHPITLLKMKVLDFFKKIGFGIVDSPEIEDDWHNFEALNFSPNHPARDMLDTFFISKQPTWLLRTHTTPMQIRIAERQPPPIRVVSVGKVYRNETISARSHCMFHQVDGVYIDQEVSFADLKQLIGYFMRDIFGDKAKVRLRPSYFPFTVLSAEIDIDCAMCQGKGCNLCKYTGWLEIMGAGMVDPQVLSNCHIDPAGYRGYAFGMGLERVAMLLHGINDLRLFTENDRRFLKQFKAFP